MGEVARRRTSRKASRSIVFPDRLTRRSAGGICRVLNRLALAALNLGALEQKDTLSEEEIYRASSEL